MGRNGTEPPVFKMLAQVINENVGLTVSSEVILLGRGLGRNVVTHYLYRLIKAGYLKPIGGPIKGPATKYLVAKEIPDGYSSVSLKNEIDAINANKN